MAGVPNGLGQQVMRSVVRTAIAIVGLLVLRAILSAMPMLRTGPVYSAFGSGVTGQMGPMPDAGQTAGAGSPQAQAFLEAMQRAMQGNANNSLPRAIQAGVDVGLDALMGYYAIYPVTIAKALIDTVIFALLIVFALNLAVMFRDAYAPLPDLGMILALALTTFVVAMAYYQYRGIAYPFLLPNNAGIYGWVFLALLLTPLVWLAVVVARNLDSLTAIVMRSGSSLVTVRPAPQPGATQTSCAHCGRQVAAGVKFCPHCGSAVSAVASAPAADVMSVKSCPACAAANPVAAKFCRSCGQPV